MELLCHELWSIQADSKMDSKSEIMNFNCVRATVIRAIVKMIIQKKKKKKLITNWQFRYILYTERKYYVSLYIDLLTS